MTINFNDVTDTATPTSGTFNTGGNANVRGTGQNLFLRSQTFTSTWGTTNSLITSNATTAPDSTNTASKLIATTTNATHNIFQTLYSFVFSFTTSIYAKASEYNWLAISCDIGGANGFAYFNLQTGVLGTVNANFSATITSAGNGWYRCTFTRNIFTSGSGGVAFYPATADNTVSFAGDNTSGIFIWGAQLELGPTANTYVPTTTAAIYGTPSLSFSGASTLGLQSDGSLFLQPAGTGAIQAQATTSTIAGGNARGPNAVDWQKGRVAATQVASSSFSFIGGGDSNTAAAFGSVVVGGSTNSTTGGAYNSIIGGVSNTTGSNGQVITIGGGHANSAQGFFNFIGCGYANSGTAGPAVTTQSATMNGTTAVTLSGSNAAIKVGQLISGTSIGSYPHTYVAAISGTSLTLSQAATGSTTNTLSFFTPHGVVVGGGNNQATGSYSFIGGGGDAGTAANRNVASGDWSVVGGGAKNTASGIGSVIVGGGVNASGFFANTASGINSFIGGGTGNTASGTASGVIVGTNNTANGFGSLANGNYASSRLITGNQGFAACNAPIAATLGVSQTSILVLGRQTTDATATVLCSDSNAAGTTNQVILPNNSAYYFRGEVIAGKTAGGDTKGWYIEGVIKRGANAASAAIVGTATVTSNYADAGASTWAVAVTADTTNGGLKVEVTGQASTTIRWVAQIRTTEMTY